MLNAKQFMAITTIIAAIALSVIPPASFAGDITLTQKVAGVYKHRVNSGDVDGKTWTRENVLELVPVSDTALYFKTALKFFNGHECNLFGIAHYPGTG